MIITNDTNKVSLYNVRIAVIEGNMGRFPFSPKFRKFRLEIKWKEPFQFCLTGIFGITFVPLHWTKLLSPVPLFCILLTRTIIRRAVAWVGSVQPESTVPLGTWNFRNSNRSFFVEWKADMVYNDLMMCLSSITIDNWPGLAPVPRLPRPSQSVHFNDVSETLGPRDPKSTGQVTKFWK